MRKAPPPRNDAPLRAIAPRVIPTRAPANTATPPAFMAHAHWVIDTSVAAPGAPVASTVQTAESAAPPPASGADERERERPAAARKP